MVKVRIGVLALQGDVAQHAAALVATGADPVPVRLPAHLEGLAGIVLPGGESTTMSMLLESSGLFDPLAELLDEGLPVLGTCAGMILLANDVRGGRDDQRGFARIDIAVRRNGYGRQDQSF
ncbi:MAG: pyridoxal 5'-phosphate synthase glutaminase subunit PdxT, partial [Acidimicrobiales bacterium]